MHINCFWVSGSFKGHGYANDLLSACIADDETKGKDKREERLSAKERELGDIKDINTSYSYDNYRKRGEYMIRHTSGRYKYSPKKDKVLGWLFFGFLITDFALIPIFAILRIYIGAIVCFSLFGGTILIC